MLILLSFKPFKICLKHLLVLFCTLKEEMATYSNILSWKIPLAEEPGGLQSMGSIEHGSVVAAFVHISILKEMTNMLLTTINLNCWEVRSH